jgi:tetratricopeptide (TPR) repeat protein
LWNRFAPLADNELPDARCASDATSTQVLLPMTPHPTTARLASIVALVAASTLADLAWTTNASAQTALDAPKIDTKVTAPTVGRPVGGQRDDRGLLGGGRALDRNLQVGSGGINAPAPRTDFNARNLIVTDSVAGGRGFRGSVGYRAADDFRGATAGDSSFRFRSDSALSSTFFLSLRGQDRFNLAQNFGAIEYRRDATPVNTIGGVRDAFDQQLRLDRAAAAIMSDRTFAFSAEPIAFATGRDSADRRVQFLASPVQGMRTRRMDDPLEQAGIPTFERARTRQDAMRGLADPARPTTPFDGMLGGPNAGGARGGGPDAKIDARIEPNRIGGPESRSNGSAYDDIVAKIVRHYADDPNVHIDANPKAIERARGELDRLREELGTKLPTTRSQPLPGDEIDPATGLPKSMSPSSPDGAAVPEDEAAKAAREAAERRRLVEETADALRHGTTVRDLTTSERARVNELVVDAQEFLAAGEFFRAERCFDQALNLNPDNPMLMAGLANSQIGAGLHLSAALTLRTLFAQSPEMIDVRYDAKLLPNETRLRLAIETLRTRISQKQDIGGYSLTLAYIGHQLRDAALVREGLETMTGSMEDDLLRELLQEIWLGGAAQPQPEAAPAAETK